MTEKEQREMEAKRHVRASMPPIVKAIIDDRLNEYLEEITPTRIETKRTIFNDVCLVGLFIGIPTFFISIAICVFCLWGIYS